MKMQLIHQFLLSVSRSYTFVSEANVINKKDSAVLLVIDDYIPLLQGAKSAYRL